ncbi:MAG: hypothetical protein HFJ84_08225 [Clostridiales bacterium]|nr:hypothetical protein [Clostridiales bacterium]
MSITTVYRTIYCLKQKGFLHITVQCVRMAVQGQYAFSDRIDTQLTLAALDMAYRRRTPPKSLIFHSDRGVHSTRIGPTEKPAGLWHLPEYVPQSRSL